MNRASEYKQQFGGRAWPRILDALPPLLLYEHARILA